MQHRQPDSKKMIQNFSLACAILLLLLLTGCGKVFTPAQELHDALRLYERSLRWMDFDITANYLDRELRKDFLDRFQDAEELRIVNVDLVSVDYHPDTRTATTEMVIEYYRLPSPNVRRLRLEQSWVYEGGDTYHTGTWQTTTPIPALSE